MGLYINPTDKSKEEWLAAYPEVNPKVTGYVGGSERLVCLVDNGRFTSAAVIINAADFNLWENGGWRHQIWYKVPISALIEVGALPPNFE